MEIHEAHSNQQITCTHHLNFRFCYGRYMGNFCKQKAHSLNLSSRCYVCCVKHIDACLHPLLCCKNKYINNLWAKKHNKVVCIYAQKILIKINQKKVVCILTQTLLAHLITRHFTLIHIGMYNNKPQRTQSCYGYYLASIVSQISHPHMSWYLMYQSEIAIKYPTLLFIPSP